MKEMQATKMKRIAAQRYDFSDEDLDRITSQIRSLFKSRSFLTMGQYGEQFEEQYASYVGAACAVAVSSGTAALEIILRALDTAGAEVIVPTNTFAATAFAVVHAGGTPVFADCAEDLVVDPVDVERRITRKTKAVIVVHIGGLVSPSIYQLQDLCRRRGLSLIEDAAHAHGSRLDGRQAGTFGEAAAFSFFPTKVMTTGEGGMIVTDNPAIDAKGRMLRDQAKIEGLNRHDTLGHNWRLSEVQAILGLAQLERLDEFVGARQRIARVYDEAFKKATHRLQPMAIPETAKPNFYKYLIFTVTELTGLASRLSTDYGVSLGGAVYDVPCHEQPVFAAFRTGPLPVAQRLCRRHVCPPIYPSLSDADVRYVSESLIEVAS